MEKKLIRIKRPFRFTLSLAFIGLNASVPFALGAECEWLFSPADFYEGVQAATSGICSADFDGDGWLDIAVANRGSDDVIVFSNDGTAQYSILSTVSIGVGSTPRYVVSGDFDGDGDIDAATANWSAHAGDPVGYNGGSVAILLNDGNGVLTLSEEHNFLRTSCLDIIDLNGDGHLDIIVPHWDPAVGSNGPGIASILKNNGDGTFVEITEVPIGNLPRGIDVGDIDNDGDFDFAISNMGSDDSVTVVENIGKFKFSVRDPLLNGITPRYLAIGDVTGDGLGDISVVHKTPNNLIVYKNDGDFNFSMFGEYPTADNPHSVEVDDIDGDCTLDVLVSHVGDNIVNLYKNDGEGFFTLTQIQSLHGPAHVITADVNEDGRKDVLTADVNGGYFNVHLSNVYQVGCEPLECRADLDNSGMVEVMDIIELISQWGTPCGPSDLNRSGVVDVLDIIELISVWGSECP